LTSISSFPTRNKGHLQYTSQFADEEIKFLARDLFCAGMETSLSTMEWALVALASNQDIQRRLHDELSVLTREPSFNGQIR
jgi:cytochrome P450